MSEESKPGWSRWQIAVAVGVPLVTIATGYVVYYYWSKKADRSCDVSSTNSAAPNSDVSSAPTVDESSDPSVAKTALEKAQAAKVTGNKYFKGRRYESALRCYREAIQLCPEDNQSELSTYYQNMAACYELLAAGVADNDQKTSYLNDLIDVATKAINLNRRYVKAYQRRARAHEQLGHRDECLRDYTAVMLLDPKQLPSCQERCNGVVKLIIDDKLKRDYPDGKKLQQLSYTYLISFYDSFSYHGYLELDALQHQWEELEHHPVDEHDTNEVVQDLTADLEKQPYWKAVKHFHALNYTQVIPFCTEAIKSGHDGMVGMATLLRGGMQYLWQQREAGLRDLQAVVDMTSVQKEVKIMALLQKSHILSENPNSMNDAFEECNKALQLMPSFSDTYVQLAKLCILEGTPESMHKAMQHFEKAASMDTTNYVAMGNLAYLQFRVGALSNSVQMMESGMEQFKKGIKQFPTKADLFVMYAQALQDMMQTDEAVKMYNKAIKLQPNSATPYVYKGLLHMMTTKDVATAIEIVEEGRDVDPYCMLVYLTLGSMELQRNTEKAIALLDKAVEVAHSDIDLEQASSVRELAVIQQEVCLSLGLNPLDVMTQQIV